MTVEETEGAENEKVAFLRRGVLFLNESQSDADPAVKNGLFADAKAAEDSTENFLGVRGADDATE